MYDKWSLEVLYSGFEDEKFLADIAAVDEKIAAYQAFAEALGSEGERETDFLNVVVWRGKAENCNKYLKKGSKCAVVGNIQTRSYDAQDGTKRYVTEIVAEDVEFISTKSSMDGEKKEVSNLEPVDDDNLPF